MGQRQRPPWSCSPCSRTTADERASHRRGCRADRQQRGARVIAPTVAGYVVVISSTSAPLVAQALTTALADGRLGAGTRAILVDLRTQCRDAAELEQAAP